MESSIGLEGGLKVRPDPLVASLGGDLGLAPPPTSAVNPVLAVNPALKMVAKLVDDSKKAGKRTAENEAAGSPAKKTREDDGSEAWVGGGIKGTNEAGGSSGDAGGSKAVRRNRKMMPAAYEPTVPLKDGKTREDAWMQETAEEQRRIFEEKATPEEREALRQAGGAGGAAVKVVDGEVVAQGSDKMDFTNKEKKPRGGQPGNKRFPEREAESVHSVPGKFQASCQVLLRMAVSADCCSNVEQPDAENIFSSGIFLVAIAYGHPQITGGRAAHKSAAAALKQLPKAVVINSPFGKKSNVNDGIAVLQQMLSADPGAKDAQYTVNEIATSSKFVDEQLGNQASAAPTHLRGGGKDPYKMVHATASRGGAAAMPYKSRPMFKQASSVFACCNVSKELTEAHPGFKTNVVVIAVERGHPPLVRGKPSEDALAEAANRKPKAQVLTGLVGNREEGLKDALAALQQALLPEPNTAPGRKFDVELVKSQDAAKNALVSQEDRAKRAEKAAQAANNNPVVTAAVVATATAPVTATVAVVEAPAGEGIKPGSALPVVTATAMSVGVVEEMNPKAKKAAAVKAAGLS